MGINGSGEDRTHFIGDGCDPPHEQVMEKVELDAALAIAMERINISGRALSDAANIIKQVLEVMNEGSTDQSDSSAGQDPDDDLGIGATSFSPKK